MRKAFMGMIALMMGSALYATAAQAQGSPVQFSVGGGLDLPLGDFDDAAKLGFHGLAGVSYAPAEWKGFGIQVDGNFSRFSDDTPDFEDIDSYQIIYGTGNLIYRFQTAEMSRFKPYLIGGGGVYNLDAKGGGAGDSETKFGINVGAGFDIAVGGGSAALFLEGRFHDVFTDVSNTQFIPITVGVRFGGSGS